MIPGRSVIASIPVGALSPLEDSDITSTQVLHLPVDYFMEDLPQYRATGRTYEPSYGRAGERVAVSRSRRGRLGGEASTVTRTTSRRGYD